QSAWLCLAPGRPAHHAAAAAGVLGATRLRLPRPQAHRRQKVTRACVFAPPCPRTHPSALRLSYPAPDRLPAPHPSSPLPPILPAPPILPPALLIVFMLPPPLPRFLLPGS